MSSDNLPSEKAKELRGKNVVWHARVKTTDFVYFMLVDEAKRQDRSISYLLSKILEKYYEEKAHPKIIG